MFDFIERDSPLVTGNCFCLLKHPETQTNIEEEFSDKFPNMIESGDPFTLHKTVDMIRFIGNAVAKHGCNLEWFLRLSPNFWPVVMRLLLSNIQVFYSFCVFNSFPKQDTGHRITNYSSSNYSSLQQVAKHKKSLHHVID